MSIGETITDNINQSPDKQTDSITTATVGLRISSNRGRLRGFFDYALYGNVYARNSGNNNLQNALNAGATGELIPGRLYVDSSASISQSLISAFGTQSTDARSSNSNRTEVRTLSLSPYLRGQVTRLIDYELRLNGSRTNSNTSAASDVTNTGGLLHLGAGRTGTAFGGSLDVSKQYVQYSLGRRSEDELIRGTLDYAVTPDLKVSGIVGRESNNYVSVDKTSHSIVGGKVDWIPSTRTKLAARYERRFFGDSHAVDFSYRTARTAWIFSDSRDVSSGQPGPNTGTTQYQVLFLASPITDLDERRRAVLNQLAAMGLNENSPPIGGFLASAPSLQRQQLLSFALLGLGDTVTFRYTRGESQALDTTLKTNDDLSASSVVKQQSIGADVSHRLSPISSLNLSGVWLQTSGSFASQKSQLRSVTASYSTRINQRVDASASVRHSSYSSTVSSYAENAVTANLRLQF